MDSRSVTSSAAGSRLDPELRAAVAELFAVFARLFCQRWAATNADDKARPAWAAALRAAGITVPMIRAGMARASTLTWPPSAGEFAALCRPPAPSESQALAQAVRWAGGAVVEWDHPAIGAAAVDVGSWNLRHMGEREARQVFGTAYRQMLERHQRGDPLNVPTTRVLPAEIHRRVPRSGPVPDQVAVEIARCASLLGVAP